MKKNKKSRMFSRVLTRLSWAYYYRACDEKENAHKEVLAAKRCLEECGGKDIKVLFYDHEYHIHFALYDGRKRYNRYYTVAATLGYYNHYHVTNWLTVKSLVQALEFVQDCELKREFHDYQRFLQVAGSVLFWALDEEEYLHFSHNGSLDEIPYNVAVDLYRNIGAVAREVVDNAIAYKKVVL